MPDTPGFAHGRNLLAVSCVVYYIFVNFLRYDTSSSDSQWYHTYQYSIPVWYHTNEFVTPQVKLAYEEPGADFTQVEALQRKL